MRVLLQAKHCRLPGTSRNILAEHLQQLERMLPYKHVDSAELNLLIERQQAHHDDDNNYEIHATLTLPHAVLRSSATGKRFSNCVVNGFDRLVRQIANYKGKHYPAHTEYARHETIRKDTQKD